MSWLPVVAFCALGVILLQKAAREDARRGLAWGRAGEGPPLSRKAYAVWGVAFLCIAWVLGEAPAPGLLSASALLISFVAVLLVGFADSSAHRRSQTRHGRGG